MIHTKSTEGTWTIHAVNYCACDLAAAGVIKVRERCVHRSSMVGAPHSNCDIIRTRVPSQTFYFIAAGIAVRHAVQARPALYI
jgi:hypothetical protein